MEMLDMVISDNIGSYCVIDNETKPVVELELLNVDKMVYEVVRVISGVPLFLEEHVKRLKKSLDLIGIECALELENIKDSIKKLAFVEQADNFNVKIIISVQNSRQMLVAYASKFYYPTDEEYAKGVFVSLLNIERDNPNVKKLNSNYVIAVAEKIQETKAFELLLINSSNQILEGSKSNAFFVHDKKVLTAPGNLVLEGITRNYVTDVCRKLDIELVEEPLSVTELLNIDAAFITGTSIKVLPVASIDNHYYGSSSNALVNLIQREYDNVINKYVQDNLC